MNRIFTKYSLPVFVLLYFVSSCNGLHTRTDTDTANSGIIHISVDESFKPVIDSQIQVFEALYPKAKIIAHYKTEADCFKDILNDSATRMIIATRGLNPKEEDFFKSSYKHHRENACPFK